MSQPSERILVVRGGGRERHPEVLRRRIENVSY
jgi:hypothetical protein